MPSFWSAVSKQLPNSFSSMTMASSIFASRPSLMAFLQARTAMGAFLAMVEAIFSAAGISSSAG